MLRAHLPRHLISATALGALSLTVLTSAGATGGAASPAVRSSLAAAPISHVIEIMLENHTFDDLFTGFPGADGIPSGSTFADPVPPSIRVGPISAPANEGDVQGGLNNSRSAELAMMDRAGAAGYQMDGYSRFPGEGLSAITTFAASTDPDLQYLARHFELAERNFQPAIAPTLPNVLDALAATSHGYLTNTVPAGGPAWSSIFDRLSAAHRSWRIYSGVPPSVFAGTVWTRLLPAGAAGDLVGADAFFADLSRGDLPAFSFVRPGVGYSEEPPEDIGEGDAWLGQLVAALAHSRYWASSVVFITYDEGGGFFDHMPPPVVARSSGYGTRTPMVIVSPFARRGLLRATTTNLSVLSFMEHLWGLAPLNALDARQDDLQGAFDFHRRPLRPPVLPVAPAETIGFYGPNILTDVAAPAAGQPITINLQVNTPGLALDPSVSGPVTLALTAPPGVAPPERFPTQVALVEGKAQVVATFSSPGYYRLEVDGPGTSRGWLTIDVGVNADTP